MTGPAGGEQCCVMNSDDDFKFSKWHVKYCYNTGIQSITGILREKMTVQREKSHPQRHTALTFCQHKLRVYSTSNR